MVFLFWNVTIVPFNSRFQFSTGNHSRILVDSRSKGRTTSSPRRGDRERSEYIGEGVLEESGSRHGWGVVEGKVNLSELTEVAAVYIPILTTTPLRSPSAEEISRGGSLIARKLRTATDPLSRYSRCVCRLSADFSGRGRARSTMWITCAVKSISALGRACRSSARGKRVEI